MGLSKDSVALKNFASSTEIHFVSCNGEQILSSAFPHQRLNLSPDSPWDL